jgi:hypothetical protein
MTFPNEEKKSSKEPEETEQFFLGLERFSPPLSEEFYERLNQRLQSISSSTEDSALADAIGTPRSSFSKISQFKDRKRNSLWKGVYVFGGAAAAIVILIGAFLLNVIDYELPLAIYDKRLISDREPDSFIGLSRELQEIKRKDKEFYATLADIIKKVRDSLNNPQAGASRELLSLLEQISEGKLEYSQQNNREIVSIGEGERFRKYYVDKGGINAIEHIILRSLIKEYSGKDLIEEKNKIQ